MSKPLFLAASLNFRIRLTHQTDFRDWTLDLYYWKDILGLGEGNGARGCPTRKGGNPLSAQEFLLQKLLLIGRKIKLSLYSYTLKVLNMATSSSKAALLPPFRILNACMRRGFAKVRFFGLVACSSE